MEYVPLLISLLLTVLATEAKKACYNHQTETYNVQDKFKPQICSQLCSVMPFFSPGNSVEAHLKMIEEAQESITIANPTFESWNSKCTHNHNQCAKNECTGCSEQIIRSEEFPIFPALLNAMHVKNISVRILTNNYSVPTCPNNLTLLDWLYLNQAEIRMYKTTSFLHAKVMIIDGGKKILISSVNYSKTSFMKNREAGVIISDCMDCPTVTLYKNVFEYDWSVGDEYVIDNQYSSDQIKYITDPHLLESPIILPPAQRIPNIYITELELFHNVQLSGYVAPDYAKETVINALQQTNSSILIHMYSFGDKDICHTIKFLQGKGVNITLLISESVAGYDVSKKCISMLKRSGVKVQKTSHQFRYSHQKYWIIDSKTVHLSTGNWDSTDFPCAISFPPKKYYKANRDMLVVMQSPDIVQHFMKVFQHDFDMGSPWNE